MEKKIQTIAKFFVASSHKYTVDVANEDDALQQALGSVRRGEESIFERHKSVVAWKVGTRTDVILDGETFSNETYGSMNYFGVVYTLDDIREQLAAALKRFEEIKEIKAKDPLAYVDEIGSENSLQTAQTLCNDLGFLVINMMSSGDSFALKPRRGEWLSLDKGAKVYDPVDGQPIFEVVFDRPRRKPLPVPAPG